MKYHDVMIDEKTLAVFCRKHGIRRLSLFGSIIHDDFGLESDVDVLVEFEGTRAPGVMGMAEMEMELSEFLGRKVDLRTPSELSRHFREEVLREAETLYDET